MTRNAFKKSENKIVSMLGRSLELSGGSPDTARSAPLDAVRPSPRQPRKHFDQAAHEQLTHSVREQGVLQPVMVRPVDGHFEIVFGERRWRAARAAGLERLPIIVRELDEAQADLLAAVENLQREELSRYEEVSYKLRLVAALLGEDTGLAIATLKALRSAPQNQPERVAQLQALFTQLGRESWVSFVTNGLPVLRLPDALVDAVQSGELDYTKAVLIARAPEREQGALLETTRSGLSHAELRGKIRNLNPGPAPRSAAALVRQQLSPRRLAALPPDRLKKVETLLDKLSELLGSE